MTIWEQVDAFEGEVRAIVERYHEEFDIPVSCIEGVLIQVGRSYAESKNLEFEAELPDDEDEAPDFEIT